MAHNRIHFPKTYIPKSCDTLKGEVLASKLGAELSTHKAVALGQADPTTVLNPKLSILVTCFLDNVGS